MVNNCDASVGTDRQSGCELVGRASCGKLVSSIYPVDNREVSNRFGEPRLLVRTVFEIRVGDGDQSRIVLPRGQGERQALRTAAPDRHGGHGLLAVPDQRHTKVLGPCGGLWTGSDQEVASLSGLSDAKALAPGRTNHNYFIDTRAGV